jgi:hypothetical protein
MLMFVLACLSLKASLARRSWPTTTGVVTHSEVATTPGPFGWRDPEQDRVVVKYSYTVGGTEYTDRCRFLPTDDHVFRQLGGYPKPGTEIEVHYQPSNPSKSAVVLGPGSLTLCFLLFGLVAIGLGCYLIANV